TGGTWLRADDPLVRALKKGALAPPELLDEDREMDPTYPLSDYFSDENTPKLKEIHVLVQLPGAQVVAAPAAPVVAPLVSVANPTPSAPAPVAPVVPEPIATPVVQPPAPVQTSSPAPLAPVAAPTLTVPQSTISPHLTPTGQVRSDTTPIQAPTSPANDTATAVALAAAISAKAKPTAKDKPKRQPKPKTKATPLAAAPALTAPAVSVSQREEPAASAIALNQQQPRRRLSLPGEKRRLQTTTWSVRASALFFYFHHELGNRNLALTCDAFEIVPGTFRNWVTKSEFYAKWVPFVQALTLREAMASMPLELHGQFQLSELHPDAKVAIPAKYVQAAKMTSSKRLHSELSTQQQSIESQVRKTKQRTSSIGGPESNGSGSSASAKTIGSGRVPKYPQQEAFLMHHVRLAWETGCPLTTAQIYALLRETFGCPPTTQGTGDENVQLQHAASEFEVRMGLNSERTAAPLSQWVSRRLEAHDWTVHARKVVPKVPKNWRETARQTAVELRALMRDVDVLVSADELFLSFYARDEGAQATTQSANNNSTTDEQETEKTGCTVVLGCELFSSTLLSPFTIMSASGGVAEVSPESQNVCVQPSHWLSPESAKQYAAFVARQFPDKQVGLIWDTASSHVSAEVLEYIAQLGVTVGFIPPGLSSVMQVCDHVFGAKRSVQNHVMERFVDRKFSQQGEQQQQAPVDGGKCRVERSSVLQWIDAAVTRVCESVSEDAGVRRVFRMLGQDPTVTNDEPSEELERHLQTLSDETIAQLLTESQLVQHLE
ncbi:hypothetical protein Gpo141_00013615, partial [Globisporangium polare]